MHCFKACQLSFEIKCSRDLKKIVESLIHQFPVTSNINRPFLVQLKLQKDSKLFDIEKLEIHQIPLKIRSKLALVRNWSSRKITIDVMAKHAEAISSSIGYAIIAALSEARGFLLHAAFLENNQKAYLVPGASGAGKSTLAKNAQRMRCIHDDKCAVRYFRGRWTAYGVPMLDNFGQVGSSINFPVNQLVLIRKGNRISQRIIRKADSFFRLTPNVIVGQVGNRQKVLQSILDFCCDIPISELTFGRSDDVSDTLLTS